MLVSVPSSYAFNHTRQAYLATDLSVADTHWARMRGLLGRTAESFRSGRGLWITPSRGVHTLAMRFPIDVLYLDRRRVVVHLEEGLKPWRIAPVSVRTVSVLELPQHTVRSTGTDVGDQIEITLGVAPEVTPA